MRHGYEYDTKVIYQEVSNLLELGVVDEVIIEQLIKKYKFTQVHAENAFRNAFNATRKRKGNAL